MSRFPVKRSLKQLYIEKHAMEIMIKQKKELANNKEMTIRQLSDLRSEEYFYRDILNDIRRAEEITKRQIDEHIER